MTPEQFKLIMEIVAIVFTGLSGALVIVWKLSHYTHQVNEKMSTLSKTVEELVKLQTTSGSDLTTLKTLFSEREKDILRLEGVSEATRKDLLSTVKSMERAIAKIDAMWLTLQRLFPAQVPPRVSDKR